MPHSPDRNGSRRRLLLRNIRRRGRNGRNGLRRRNRPLFRSRLDLPRRRSHGVRIAVKRQDDAVFGAFHIHGIEFEKAQRLGNDGGSLGDDRAPPPNPLRPTVPIPLQPLPQESRRSDRPSAPRRERRQYLRPPPRESQYVLPPAPPQAPAKGFRQEPLSRQASPPELRPAFRPALPPERRRTAPRTGRRQAIPQRAARSSVLPAAQRPDPLRTARSSPSAGSRRRGRSPRGGRVDGRQLVLYGRLHRRIQAETHGIVKFPQFSERQIALYISYFVRSTPSFRPMPRAFAVPHEAFSNPSVSSYFNFSKV